MCPSLGDTFVIFCFYGFWGCVSEVFSRRLFGLVLLVILCYFITCGIRVPYSNLSEALDGVNKTRLMYRCNLYHVEKVRVPLCLQVWKAYSPFSPSP